MLFQVNNNSNYKTKANSKVNLKTMSKVSNAKIVDAIKLHFASEGKRLTNLQKATRPKLDEIIKKYNLDLDELLAKLELSNEREKERREQEKRDQEELDIQRKKEQKQKEADQTDRWNTLSADDKERVKQFAYDQYVQETQYENEKAIRTTDIMESKFRSDGVTNIQKINQYTLCVRGVTIIYGHVMSIYPKDAYLRMYSELQHNKSVQSFIIELFDAELVKQGWTKGDDGEYYKTIMVKRKPKKIQATANMYA
jgi:hypothetical protein